jgi:hypothetical protein
MPSEVGLGVTLTQVFVRAWTRLYTAGLPATVRDRRRAEIDSDLWECVQEGLPSVDLWRRLVCGVPSDLLWRTDLITTRMRTRSAILAGPHGVLDGEEHTRRWLGVVLLVTLVGVGSLFYIKSTAKIGRTAQGSLFYGFYNVGLRLPGTAVTIPVKDWSWTDTIRWAQIETRPWYGIPYHVTVDFARDVNDNALYLHSSYAAPWLGYKDIRDDFGAARVWNRNLLRDPHMRFKLWGDDRIFSATATFVTDPVEYEKARQAFHTKLVGQGAGACAPAGSDPPPCGLEKSPPQMRTHTYYFRLTPEYRH